MELQSNQKQEISKTLQRWVLLLIILGIFLRTTEYLNNRALWVDEAGAANNLQHYSLRELIIPAGGWIGKASPYPAGFLVLSKWAMSLGRQEYFLRLIPFLSSVLSLIIFSRIVSWFLSPRFSLVAVGFMAISRDLIYYASEFKPYSNDVLIALGLIAVFCRVNQEGLSLKNAFMISIVGFISIWFSHAAIFVLAAGGLGLIIKYLENKGEHQSKLLCLPLLCWSVSLILYYFISLRF